jgi:hypothetical protein
VVGFTPRPLYPGVYWTGDYMGPRSGQDAVAKRKIPSFPLSRTEPQFNIVLIQAKMKFTQHLSVYTTSPIYNYIITRSIISKSEHVN